MVLVLFSLFVLCSWRFLERMMMMLGRKVIWLMFLLYLSTLVFLLRFALTLLLWPTKSSRTLNQMWVSKCRYSLSIVEYLTSPINLLFNLYSLCACMRKDHIMNFMNIVVLHQNMFESESKCWRIQSITLKIMFKIMIKMYIFSFYIDDIVHTQIIVN